MTALKILSLIIRKFKQKLGIKQSSCSEYSDLLYLTSLESQNKKNVWWGEIT